MNRNDAPQMQLTDTNSAQSCRVKRWSIEVRLRSGSVASARVST